MRSTGGDYTSLNDRLLHYAASIFSILRRRRDHVEVMKESIARGMRKIDVTFLSDKLPDISDKYTRIHIVTCVYVHDVDDVYIR